MAGINVEYINPFLVAASKVLKDMVFIDVKVGKPYTKEAVFGDKSLLIMLGVTGEMTGQVILTFDNDVALDVASKMCMMQLPALDELAESAISELCNMILGNTATVFSTKGIAIDITPPTICKGTVMFTNNYAANICIPLIYEDDKKIEINVAIKEH
ncbi:MAG: chemotaxis protein CheX [Clostridiales bacterium]|nr:chemotaxis protein CheX [Clostridiales bacterium]